MNLFIFIPPLYVAWRCTAFSGTWYTYNILLYPWWQSIDNDNGKNGIVIGNIINFGNFGDALIARRSAFITDHSVWSAQKKHDIEMISCWGKCSLFRRALLAMCVWLDLSRGRRAAEGSRSAAAAPDPTSGIAAALSVHRQSGLWSFFAGLPPQIV